jgi:hypothetical protein
MTARAALRAALVAAVISSGFVGPAQAAGHTWYVQAGATTSAGTALKPFGTLAQVEHGTKAGDSIVVLPASGALDGGLQLKANQTLRGAGGSVLTAGDVAPRLTNTTSRLDGDAIRLADGATVANIRVTDALRGAVYGLNVTGVRVTGSDISGQNTSCTRGFHIPEFEAPTNVPGVGIPISGGLPNGWAGIMVDATSRTGVTIAVDHNAVHHAECGDGIDVRFSGSATGSATISDNNVHHLRQGNGLKSVLAIGLQSRDTARLSATVDGNRQADLGNEDDLNFAVEGADSEGVFLNAVGPATLNATVSNNKYTNEAGWGGFSANGLEMVSMGSGARMNAVVRDSSFSGATVSSPNAPPESATRSSFRSTMATASWPAAWAPETQSGSPCGTAPCATAATTGCHWAATWSTAAARRLRCRLTSRTPRSPATRARTWPSGTSPSWIG